jgi:hypothetical protein
LEAGCVTDIGTLVDELIAAGAHPAAAARIVTQAYVAGLSNTDRRSPAAIRQQRYRDRKTDGDMSSRNVTKRNDVTDNSIKAATSHNAVTVEPETVSLSPIPLLPPTPPNNPLTPNPIQKPNSARGFRLPDDWTLTGPDLAFALSKGFSEAQTAEIFEKFTNYWWSATGAKATKKNWHQAWKVWVLNTRPQSRAGPSFAKPLTAHQYKQQEMKDVLNELADFATGGSSGGEPNPGILRHDPGSGPQGIRGGVGSDVDDLPPRRH